MACLVDIPLRQDTNPKVQCFETYLLLENPDLCSSVPTMWSSTAKTILSPFAIDSEQIFKLNVPRQIQFAVLPRKNDSETAAWSIAEAALGADAAKFAFPSARSRRA